MSRLSELVAELCPDGVEYKTLGEVCTFNRGQTITKKNSIEGPIPVVSGGTEPAYYVSENNRTGETVTVAGSGAGAGFVSYWNEPIWCGDSFSVDVKEGISITPRFLYEYLKANENYIRNKKQGAGVPHVHGKQLKNMRIPVPPLEVQREIVRILNSFQELDDVLTTEIEAREKQFETSMALLMNRMFASYSTDKLGSLMTVVRGASPRPIKKYMATAEEGVHWIKIGDVGVGGKFITDTAEYVTQEGADKSRLLKRGSFVLSNSMSFGRPYILDIDGCIHDGWLALSEYEETFNRDFLYYLLRSDQVQMVWRMVASNSTVRNLNSDIVRDTDVPIPAMSDQEHVATVLNEIFALIDCLREERDARRKQFEYYRDCLLAFPEKVA